jgi:hypothetical protein
MNKTLQEIFNKRADLSDYLFHFTKGFRAKQTLEKILVSKAIKDIKDNGYICFTDSPILMLEDMFQIFDNRHAENPLYARYGIGIKKDVLFDLGARQVTYVPEQEYSTVPFNLQWRHQIHKPNENDFSWLREWRLPEKEFALNPENFYFITRFTWETENFTSPPAPEDIAISTWSDFDGSEMVSKDWFVTRRYRGISFEQINSFKHKSDIDTFLDSQRLGDVLEVRELASGQLVRGPRKT